MLRCVSYICVGLILFQVAIARPPTYPKMEDISEKPISARKSSDTIDSSKENSLESVVLAIDTGVKKFMAGKTKPSNIVDDVAKQLLKYAKNSGKPVYKRSGVQDYNIKPELIHLQSSDSKPSVVLEINSKSIVNVLKDLLQSKSVHEYIDPYTKKAAVIYRAVREELDKSYANEMRNTE